MKLIKIYFALIAILLSSCVAERLATESRVTNFSKSEQYVIGSDDIPLVSGLSLIEDDSSSFDAMFGNIVISKYVGDVKLQSVKDFYLKTLPQLGWKVINNKKDNISFVREKDNLEIKFNSSGNKLYVRFFISSLLR